jgi:putative transposase
MWKALVRAGEPVGRDRVKRLMRRASRAPSAAAGRGARPGRTLGRPDARTWWGATSAHRRPDRLWVADLSYLRCWEGLVFFAFVIDA